MRLAETSAADQIFLNGSADECGAMIVGCCPLKTDPSATLCDSVADCAETATKLAMLRGDPGMRARAEDNPLSHIKNSDMDEVEEAISSLRFCVRTWIAFAETIEDRRSQFAVCK
jgi:hypothetical protein